MDQIICDLGKAKPKVVILLPPTQVETKSYGYSMSILYPGGRSNIDRFVSCLGKDLIVQLRTRELKH